MATATKPKKDTTCNGWPNRETWCVHLWLSSEEWSYKAIEAAKSRVRDETGAFGYTAAGRLTGYLKSIAWHWEDLRRDICPREFSNREADRALDRVKWRHLAQSLLED